MTKCFTLQKWFAPQTKETRVHDDYVRLLMVSRKRKMKAVLESVETQGSTVHLIR
jgi:hypothetical protein